MIMAYWIIIALIVIGLVSVFGYMAYRDEKEIDEDLRKADEVRDKG